MKEAEREGEGGGRGKKEEGGKIVRIVMCK